MHSLEDLILIKYPNYPKFSRLNSIPTKISWHFFAEIEKYPNIHMKSQGILNSQNNLDKEKQNGEASHFLIPEYISQQ